MDHIDKFLNEHFTRVVTEDKNGIKCIFKHKDGLTDDSVVFFEFAKKGWSQKPIQNKRQYVIVDADTRELIDFLSKYFNLTEEDYNGLRKILIDISIESLDKFYGD